MPQYEIEQFELHVMKYRVEADSEAEAIAKLFEGDAEPVEQSQEYIEVAEDFGIPVEQHQELADQLRDLGIHVGEAVIPSIRAIVKVK
jgi:type III secretion system FlhB-like substrate exporter